MNSQDFVLLESGKEFFTDFFDELEKAKECVLIKQFLWRNDGTGQKVAAALLKCMQRGVRVTVIKDRLGAFYEYGEGHGQSFFHDEPMKDTLFSTHSLATVYFQARFFFSKFYRNAVSSQSKNPLREAFIQHPNARVVDSYKLYDHSKIVVIDGGLAYIGGVGFADEFGEGQDHWCDYMLKIKDPLMTQNLIETLADLEPLPTKENRFYTEAHQPILDAIHICSKELIIEMPFLGNPSYIEALAAATKRGVQVHLHVPERASSHHYRNLHFLKTLLRRSKNSSNMHLTFSSQMLHGKTIICDGSVAFFGSHNLNMDQRVVREITLESRAPLLIETLLKRLKQNSSRGKTFTSVSSWVQIILPSRLEYLSVKLQTVSSRWRAHSIARARQQSQEFILIHKAEAVL
ncbi:MAG: phospholipase D-like domain-containing protein [Patescibacteria group bacterium]